MWCRTSVLLGLLAAASGFYLPGIAPVEYGQGQKVSSLAFCRRTPLQFGLLHLNSYANLAFLPFLPLCDDFPVVYRLEYTFSQYFLLIFVA